MASEPSLDPKHEDDGVILSTIHHEEPYLLILDAETFEEIGRAALPWQIPGSFHGQYFEKN